MRNGNEFVIDDADANVEVIIDDHLSIGIEFEVLAQIGILIANRRFTY
jgi:hypothetical protein